MKLKTEFQDEDFKLGEVADVNIATMPDGRIKAQAVAKSGGVHTFFYDDLKTFTNDWEDAPEEPKEYWFIDEYGMVQQEIDYYYDENKSAVHDKRLEVGNYFQTKEEAEKAVEKLKAMAKLKEFGFRFIDWELDMKTIADGKIWFDIGVNTEWDAERLLELKPEVKKSLDILFSQEGD